MKNNKNFIIPSIDLLDGKIVRLYKGDFDQKTVYNMDVLTLCENYSQFQNLHIVDLNAAKGQGQKNIEIIREIRKNFSGKIQLGGGIRDLDMAQNMIENEKIDRVVLGTIAIKNPRLTLEILQKLSMEKVVLALDCDGNKFTLKTDGWLKNADCDLFSLLSQYEKFAKYLLITDVNCDGAENGPNCKLYTMVKEKFPSFHLQASGGIANFSDIENLMQITDSAITGKALYSGLMTHIFAKDDLHLAACSKRAEISQKFFKTAKGQYGYGDIFIGVDVPTVRQIAKKYTQNATFSTIQSMMQSKIHEERLLGLFFLVDKYQNAKSLDSKREICDFYLSPKIAQGVNNWDLVDTSCYKILGDFCMKNKDFINTLYSLAKSDNLWLKRISIVSNLALIKAEIFTPCLDICTLFLADKEDLIAKACGWMLREIGKKNIDILSDFLLKNASKMPRIMLSYAIEKMPKEKQIFYRNL
ncbi:HisA/HisF-related TIM barrel protein [Candidatus Deianiraea vastatrix]|uniref:1-(5-phosphoribosyl)-5-[(5-phosphoribosylamino)methylideneamino] imidazole-4-carboxamide isomerase n=1 Tax=Candidatus Deianiraea vastatrix TaxID=2163644 RepID=A0A5B8XE48_9RICK|nr:HisA/HisF-related TIM barrel protein [Candidatus Deianiraea vastatrix]QED23619.1 fused 1-(5-phosphoribosyl)-5-[(5-phosphoribosylamino)methylideneamino] imidazole-4-carboxamide isomerase + DNA alkylation repair protein [Candidatus Deianiraea vastatrix]